MIAVRSYECFLTVCLKNNESFSKKLKLFKIKYSSLIDFLFLMQYHT